MKTLEISIRSIFRRLYFPFSYFQIFHFLENLSTNLSISQNYHQIHSNFLVYHAKRRANRFSSSLSSLSSLFAVASNLNTGRSIEKTLTQLLVSSSGTMREKSRAEHRPPPLKLFNTIETELSDVTDEREQWLAECSKIKPCPRSLFTWNNGDPLGKSAGTCLR